MARNSPKENISLGSIDIIEYHNSILKIQGWILNPQKKFDTLIVEINDNRFESIIRVQREDVVKAYPHIKHALGSGFICHIFLENPPDHVHIGIYGIVDTIKIAKIERDAKIEGKISIIQKFEEKFHSIGTGKNHQISNYWDKNVKIHDKISVPISWLDSSIVRSQCIKKLSINDQEYPINEWLIWVKEKFVPTPLSYGLSIGCGDGSLERHAIKLNICSKFDAYDISKKSISIATEQSKKEGIDQSINYYVIDVNKIVLENEKFDFIFFGSSLHHIKNLECVLEECKKSLKPDGILVLNEYIGPSQFQWTDQQLTIINELLEIIPPRLKIDSITGMMRTNVSRPSIEYMNKNDPSEAIRSAEIISLVSKNFSVIERFNFGGTILHMLLHSIVNNFNPSDENDLGILKLLGYIEQKFIDNDILPSDFALIVAKKTRMK
jgi:2-polyprenyl-3-methyl-5-hydroxy-6-metoxy-1,4-benzoquinol methylase